MILNSLVRALHKLLFKRYIHASLLVVIRKMCWMVVNVLSLPKGIRVTWHVSLKLPCQTICFIKNKGNNSLVSSLVRQFGGVLAVTQVSTLILTFGGFRYPLWNGFWLAWALVSYPIWWCIFFFHLKLLFPAKVLVRQCRWTDWEDALLGEATLSKKKELAPFLRRVSVNKKQTFKLIVIFVKGYGYACRGVNYKMLLCLPRQLESDLI